MFEKSERPGEGPPRNALPRRRVARLAILAGPALLAIAASGFGQGPAPFFTRPASPVKAPGPDGFLQRWLLLDPIRVEIRSNAQLTDSFVQAAIKKEYFPGQFAVLPRDGDMVTSGDAQPTWHAVDTSAYNVNLYHFACDLGKPAFNVVFWAVTVVNCPRDMSGVRLAVGSNSASIWWLNGREVIDLYGDRHMIADDSVSKRLTLNKGPNIVRCAVINSPGVEQYVRPFSRRGGQTVDTVHGERWRGRKMSVIRESKTTEEVESPTRGFL